MSPKPISVIVIINFWMLFSQLVYKNKFTHSSKLFCNWIRQMQIICNYLFLTFLHFQLKIVNCNHSLPITSILSSIKSFILLKKCTELLPTWPKCQYLHSTLAYWSKTTFRSPRMFILPFWLIYVNPIWYIDERGITNRGA